jgi:hypothetical protein
MIALITSVKTTQDASTELTITPVSAHLRYLPEYIVNGFLNIVLPNSIRVQMQQNVKH